MRKSRPNSYSDDTALIPACRARARELPDNYPFVVRAKYVSSITDKWRSPAQILCNQTYNVLFKYMKELVHKHFASFGQGNLEQRVG